MFAYFPLDNLQQFLSINGYRLCELLLVYYAYLYTHVHTTYIHIHGCNVGPIGHCLPTTTTPTPELPPPTTTIPETTAATMLITTPASPKNIATTTTTTTNKPSITNNKNTTTTTTDQLNIQQQQQQTQTQRSAPLNACSPENCLNGGTCLGYSSNYTCICASGYTGLAINLTSTRVALGCTTWVT